MRGSACTLDDFYADRSPLDFLATSQIEPFVVVSSFFEDLKICELFLKIFEDCGTREQNFRLRWVGQRAAL